MSQARLVAILMTHRDFEVLSAALHMAALAHATDDFVAPLMSSDELLALEQRITAALSSDGTVSITSHELTVLSAALDASVHEYGDQARPYYFDAKRVTKGDVAALHHRLGPYFLSMGEMRAFVLTLA